MPAAPAGGTARGGPLSESSAFRCAVAGEERAESVAGTASTFAAFLLVEHPGPWGVDALRHARLPDGVGPALKSAGAAAGVKVLLMRRPGRATSGRHRVFAVFAGGRDRAPFMETAVFDRPDEALGIDLAALRAGRSVGLARHDQPIFGVCTHGRHDACCAERGRPVAAALAAAYPEQTWELSHLGGDRFAANLLVAPDGLYYGRVDPVTAVAVAEARMRGEVVLDHLRGRSSLPMPVQYAEIALRRELGLVGLDAVRPLGRQVDGAESRARFAVDRGASAGSSYSVVVRSRRGEPVRLTCHASRAEPPIVHELVGIAKE